MTYHMHVEQIRHAWVEVEADNIEDAECLACKEALELDDWCCEDINAEEEDC